LLGVRWGAVTYVNALRTATLYSPEFFLERLLLITEIFPPEGRDSFVVAVLIQVPVGSRSILSTEKRHNHTYFDIQYGRIIQRLMLRVWIFRSFSLDCTCFQVGRSSRGLTELYDECSIVPCTVLYCTVLYSSITI
jgi:hypothetical protein